MDDNHVGDEERMTVCICRNCLLLDYGGTTHSLPHQQGS